MKRKHPSKWRACSLVELNYKARDGKDVSVTLGPREARVFMSRLGLSRRRIREELNTLFRYGRKVRAMSLVEITPKLIHETVIQRGLRT